MSDRSQDRPLGHPLPTWWFRVLKVGHDPRDPAEATLVLAAAAAANGLRCDGEPMEGAQFGTYPSMQEIAKQLMQPISAVRRGVEHLIARKAIYIDAGIQVQPEALADRWGNYRQRLSITTEARLLRMRPRALLVTGLVAGQVNEHGHLRLGIQFLMERTGFPRRSLERALAAARAIGGIHTWSSPPEWQLYLAVGPSQTGARRTSQSGARRDANEVATPPTAPSATTQRCESAEPPITNRRDPYHETAEPPSRNGARPPDSPGIPPDSPTDIHRLRTPASPVGETRDRVPDSAPDSEKAEAPPPADASATKAHIDEWVRGLADTWCLHATNDNHVSLVTSLLDKISPRPPVIHNQTAFCRERIAFAKGIIQWCPSPERLGRWLVRVERWFKVENLGAYLRHAAAKNEPGTLLDSHSKNVVGRAAETWQDFTPATERALNGPRIREVKKVVESVSALLCEQDPVRRESLRIELRRYWSQHRPVAARTVLLKLLGGDRTDTAIQQAVEGIFSLREARGLLGAA